MQQAMHASRIHHLETVFGLRISDDALPFATQLLDAYRNESTLQEMDPIQLVERACRRLRKKDIDRDSQESSLNWDEYYLDRAYVEVMELRKEKSVACRTDVLPRVEKELAELTRKWDCFQKKWAPVLAQQRNESGKRMALLKCLRHEMIYFMNTTSRQGFADEEFRLQLPPLLSSLTNELQLTVDGAFQERFIVGPCEIAQMASVLTDLPKKCFHWPFELRMLLRIEDLKSKLSKELIELDDVIHKIGRALSKQKSVRGPLGSFLLLGPLGCGRSKLAEALAEGIYGDKERCIELDMSKCKEPNIVLKLLNHFSRLKKNGCVVMFENIENAHPCSQEILSQILRDGILTDEQGMGVSFYNDLVLVSSHIGHEVFCHCECLRVTVPKVPFKEILIEPALLHEGLSDNNCHLHQFYTMVANQFDFEFMDLFNDVLVFPQLTVQNHMAISRLQMRDVAETMSIELKKRVILYPSDAAVVNMMCYRDILERGAHAYEDWHKVYLEPKLNEILKNEVDDMLIIYIDALVGLGKEFSFRVENGSHLEKRPVLKRLKDSLSKLRSSYRQEKQQVNHIYRIQAKCSHLCELIGSQVDIGHVLSETEDVVISIDHLLRHKPSDSNELELVRLDSFNCEAEVSSCDRKTKRAKICLEHVSRRLQISLKQRDKATQAITDALLRRLRTSNDEQSYESNNLPASFLCLGLTPKSKKQFSESLGEHLVMDDGQKSLFQVDLSLCTEPESFFRCPCSMNAHLLLTEAVKKSPHSVIIFHQLEMAHITVFSTILSILDGGIAKDSEGNITSFENCVVIFASNLGNKDIICKLNKNCSEIRRPVQIEVESTSEEAVGSSPTDEMAKDKVDRSRPTNETVPRGRGLRFELLYRLDQLLLFDPFSDDQLNQFVMLPMKSLAEKSHSLCKTFSDLLNVKGEKKQNGDGDEIISVLKELWTMSLK